MIKAEDFLTAAKAGGFTFFTGVPCSFLTPLINRVIGDRGLSYVGAASEGEAVAIASGAWLAGRETVVMCQNSGLGNTINPLTSLNYPFRIPTLLIVTWRGQPGIKDEPQHELMGQITQHMLDTCRIEHRPFPAESGAITGAIGEAKAAMRRARLPFAFVMQQGTIADEALEDTAPAGRQRGAHQSRLTGAQPPTRVATLERFLDVAPEAAAVVATTGKCGRELFTLVDRRQHLYQVGSMGAASAMGLGVALNTQRRVIVLDGDGAALMKLGNLSTIGAQAPANLLHIVLDNGVHDSTGGQRTAAHNVDFAAVAIACGYRRAVACDALDAFGEAVAAACARSGPELIHMKIAPGSLAKLGRPTITPREVADRFKAFLAEPAAEHLERVAVRM
jgi:phosphonopyruvate decarboxylase